MKLSLIALLHTFLSALAETDGKFIEIHVIVEAAIGESKTFDFVDST